jgi:hypothetical protein
LRRRGYGQFLITQPPEALVDKGVELFIQETHIPVTAGSERPRENKTAAKTFFAAVPSGNSFAGNFPAWTLRPP